MSAQFAKDRVSFATPTNFSAAAPTTFAPAGGSMFGPVGKWFANLMQRRAVIEELSMLTDHELADIGLTRGEIPMVFDQAFAASHRVQYAARC